MSKVYFPLRYEDVPASAPHEGDPAYRVSYGIEHWGDGSAHHVYKVQMVYGGNVAGRKSASFPADTDDLDRVADAMRRIKAGKGKSGRGMIEAVGEEPGLSSAEAKEFMAENGTTV